MDRLFDQLQRPSTCAPWTAMHHAGTLDVAPGPGARAVPARSRLETTKPPGMILTPRGHSQLLRAETSRAPKLRAVPARSRLETTRAPGVTLTPRGHSPPLRAGTSRAPKLRPVAARCGSRVVNVARLSSAPEPTRPLRTGTVCAPPLRRMEATRLMVHP